MSEWIEWHGGSCPVDDLSKIEVRYRDGWEQRYRMAHSEPDWSHMETDPDGDIVAYRIIRND